MIAGACLLAAGCDPVKAPASRAVYLVPSDASVFDRNPSLDPALAPAPGQRVRDAMALGGRAAPLPPGDWSVVAIGAARRRGQVREIGAALESHDGRALRSMLIVTTNVRGQETAAESLTQACKDEGVLRHDVRAAASPATQDCVLVDFDSMPAIRSFVGRGDMQGLSFFNLVLADALTGLDERNIATPQTVIEASITLWHGSDYILASEFHVPEADGVASDPSPSRSANGWALANLANDPAKAAYVERVSAQAEAYRLRLQEALVRPPDP